MVYDYRLPLSFNVIWCFEKGCLPYLFHMLLFTCSVLVNGNDRPDRRSKPFRLRRLTYLTEYKNE